MQVDCRRALSTVLALLALAPLPAAEAPPPSPAGEALSIRISPRTVYRRARYRLEAAPSFPPRSPRGDGPAAGVRVRWSVSGGRLVQDLGPRVIWQAPERAGRVKVRVECAGGGPAARAEQEVEVREASREDMVRVPAGVFTMGDTWTETSDPRYVPTDQNKFDRPPRPVHLDEYWIDRFKVTNRLYARFLESALEEGLVKVDPLGVLGELEGSTGYFFRFRLEPSPLPPREAPPLQKEITWDGARFRIRSGCEEHPVFDVTWLGSAAYAAYHGKRLPSEAEWEKAARGTDGRRFPWGNELPTRHHANLGNFYPGPTPVGMFSPRGDSPWGACDMLGNGHEWVNDWFNADFFADHSSGLPQRNPAGPDWGPDHVIRGLSRLSLLLASPREASPLSFRYAWFLEFSYGDSLGHAHTGFRTALTP